MSFSLLEIGDFQRIFQGRTDAYGIHIYSDDTEKNGKQKGDNFTKVEPLYAELYNKHLAGIQGLGIVPICNDSKVFFAVIDVDVYTNKVDQIVDNIYKSDYPLVPFRSKSGGLHIYMFFERSIKAAKAVGFLETFSRLLGLNSKTEIFPKQTRASNDTVGNWINLPYYNGNETTQYLIGINGKHMPLSHALAYIKDKRANEDTVDGLLDSIPMQDAPPCLQTISAIGDTDYRNEYLFNLARYLKTKHGDNFEFKIADANNELKNPLTIDELNKSVIAAHKKKDYSYKCTQEPIVSLCDKELCKSRRYGVGGSEISELSYEDFIQINTDPPYYIWHVNGKPLKFYNELDIINQQKFRELCFRELHILPVRLKDINWTAIINRALHNVIMQEEEDGNDISIGAMFIDNLVEFLESRAMAANRQQVLFDRVYKDDTITSYVFKSKNLVSFLVNQKQFRYYGHTEIQERLKTLGGRPARYYIGKGIGTARLWLLPYTAVQDFVEEQPTEGFIVDFSQEYKGEAF